MVNFGYPYNDIVICKDSTDYLNIYIVGALTVRSTGTPVYSILLLLYNIYSALYSNKRALMRYFFL